MQDVQEIHSYPGIVVISVYFPIIGVYQKEKMPTSQNVIFQIQGIIWYLFQSFSYSKLRKI